MKQIDFNAYLRNKYDLDVDLPDNRKDKPENASCMNIIHNRLQMRQSDEGRDKLMDFPVKSGHVEPFNNIDTSHSSKKRTGSSKIIHLNKFK